MKASWKVEFFYNDECSGNLSRWNWIWDGNVKDKCHAQMLQTNEMKQVLGQTAPRRFFLFAMFNRKTRETIILSWVFCKFEDHQDVGCCNFDLLKVFHVTEHHVGPHCAVWSAFFFPQWSRCLFCHHKKREPSYVQHDVKFPKYSWDDPDFVFHWECALDQYLDEDSNILPLC